MGTNGWSSDLMRGFEFPNIKSEMSLPDTVKAVISAVTNHLKNSKAITNFLAALPKGKGTYCSDSPVEELQRYVATRVGKIDKSDPVININFHKAIMMPVARFEREIILKGLMRIYNISRDENMMFLAGNVVAGAHDEFWAEWYKQVVVPFHSLIEEEKALEEFALGEILNKFDYTAFIGGSWLPWSQAFPIYTVGMVLALISLESHLNSPVIKNYLRTLREAYDCADISQLENYWPDVDRAWIQIPNNCRVFPVHGMESGYEHPFGVSPEFRIMVRTDIGKDIIKSFREATPVYAEILGADPVAIRQKLERMDMGVFYTGTWAGTCLNFRYAGQVVPNRQDILAEGGKIFMDQDTTENHVEIHRKYLDDNCAPDAAAWLKPYINFDSVLTATIDHECFHPAGCSRESDIALGATKKLLEESKATMGGLWVRYKISRPEARLAMVAFTVARFCRFFHYSTFNDPTVAAYVRENMVACNLMHEAGVVDLVNEGFVVNKERAANSAWFDKIEGFVKQMILAYKNHDKELIEKLNDKYCKKDGFVLSAIDWVNRK